MLIESCPCGPFATNTYVIGCPSTSRAVIIDPAPGSLSFLQSMVEKHQMTVSAIWLTHSHIDHIGDLAEAKKVFHVPVYVHELDKPNVERPGSDGLPPFLTVPATHVDYTLQDADTLSCGNYLFTVLHTPGHTPGGVCFYCKEQNVLLSGDTLFQGTIGNISFPTAEPKKMWKSLKKLGSLPPNTKVYPGHGEPTTIGQEIFLNNPEHYFG